MHTLPSGRFWHRLGVLPPLLLGAALSAAPKPTTTPIEGLRDASPRTHALVGRASSSRPER